MKLSEFILKTHSDKCYNIRPTIFCKDGFNMSVQGSESHYCSPRINTTLYSEMEIGFPSCKERMLMKYAEDSKQPTDTVYGYVPISIIEKVIKKHGGIDTERTF